MAARQAATELQRGESTGSNSMVSRNGIASNVSTNTYATFGEGYVVRHAVEGASPAPEKPEYNAEEHPENNDPKFPSIIKRGNPTEFADRASAFKFMEEMLGNGVDVNSVDRYGNTAMHYNYEHPEVVTWLLEHGANINHQNNEGWTALHVACDDWNDHYNAALFLVEHGADPNFQGCQGRTPLHLACYKHLKSGQTRAMLIKMLLANGADPNLEWKEGTPLHAAAVAALQEPELDEPEVLHALIDANGDVNIRAASDGNTPLQRLVQMDGQGFDPEKGVAVAKYLIGRKADFTSPCGNGVPPRRAAKSVALRQYFANKG